MLSHAALRLVGPNESQYLAAVCYQANQENAIPIVTRKAGRRFSGAMLAFFLDGGDRMFQEAKCPLCGVSCKTEKEQNRDVSRYYCGNCGNFWISDEAKSQVSTLGNNTKDALPILSHAVWKAHKSTKPPEITTQWIDRVLKAEKSLNPSEQAENMLLLIGQETGSFGESLQIKEDRHKARIGCRNGDELSLLLRELLEQKLISERHRTPEQVRTEVQVNRRTYLYFQYHLTLLGWNRFNELRKASQDSRRAFMAMQYGDEVLDRVYSDYFKPAVSETGFHLCRLDENPPAGLIDVRMEVEIRRSRFVIADITHGNRGAYWEAGFATGLGKHVIYTCRKDVSEKRARKRVHFDVDHRLYVTWDPAEPEVGANRLKNVIRATLPTASFQEDKGSSVL